MNPVLLIIYQSIYGLTIIGFCSWWSENFSRHTTYKGDEFFILVQFLLVLTYGFYLVIQFTIKRINFIWLIALLLVTAIAAFFIGILVLLFTGLSGIPRHYIFLYGLLYGLIAIVAFNKFWGQVNRNV